MALDIFCRAGAAAAGGAHAFSSVSFTIRGSFDPLEGEPGFSCSAERCRLSNSMCFIIALTHLAQMQEEDLPLETHLLAILMRTSSVTSSQGADGSGEGAVEQEVGQHTQQLPLTVQLFILP